MLYAATQKLFLSSGLMNSTAQHLPMSLRKTTSLQESLRCQLLWHAAVGLAVMQAATASTVKTWTTFSIIHHLSHCNSFLFHFKGESKNPQFYFLTTKKPWKISRYFTTLNSRRRPTRKAARDCAKLYSVCLTATLAIRWDFAAARTHIIKLQSRKT